MGIEQNGLGVFGAKWKWNLLKVEVRGLTDRAEVEHQGIVMLRKISRLWLKDLNAW